MAFDYKKEYKEFYLPAKKPSIIDVPEMNFIAVDGKGDPNEENGEYTRALGLLYGLAYTIRMSAKGGRHIEGFFEYVVPPLEGFWEMEGLEGIDYAKKSAFTWTSAIRLPEFVKLTDFEAAARIASEKKKMDFSAARYLTYTEGLCVQCMHIGPYDDEPATLSLMHACAQSQGYVTDITTHRRHHEIYLNDARKCAPERLRTVIRVPVRKV